MFRKLLPNTEFSRNVFTLVKGTSVAQAIPLLIAPILTRIYTTDELGALAYVVSIVAVLAVVSTGRYEMAILLPETDRQARHVLVTALIFTLISAAAIFLLQVLFYPYFSSFFSTKGAGDAFFWTVPLVLSLAAYQSLYYWYNRKKEYRLLSQNRVVQNATNGTLNIITGLLSFHVIGLIISRLVSQIVTVLYLVMKKSVPLKDIKKKELKQVSRQYVKFPSFLIFAHTLNAVSMQLPVLLITTYFGASIAGLFSLAQRVIMTPLAIVSNSIGDVFRQEASQQFVRTGECSGIYLRTLRKLITISLLPFMVFYFMAPPVFSFIFGEAWAATGEYAQILTFMFFMQFITRPLANMFLIAQKQLADVLWQILMFTSALLSFLIGYYQFDSVLISLTLFSISRGICYLYALIAGYYFSRGSTIKQA